MKNILLVDNDPDEHLIFSLAVEKAAKKYNLFTAFSAQEAIEHLQNANIEIIFLDVHMPMDGFTCFKLIKQQFPSVKNIPFYFYTGNAGEEIVARARVLNASGILGKQADLTVLAHSIDSLMDRQSVLEFVIA